MTRNGAAAAGHDALFLRFAYGIFLILVTYGAGMTAVILFGDLSLGSKMLTAFTGMFAAALGLGSGYLLGTASAQTRGSSGDAP